MSVVPSPDTELILPLILSIKTILTVLITLIALKMFSFPSPKPPSEVNRQIRLELKGSGTAE